MNPIATSSHHFMEIEMGSRLPSEQPIFLDPKAPPPAPKPLPPWLGGVFAAVGLQPIFRKFTRLNNVYKWSVRGLLLWTYWYLYTIHIFLYFFRPSNSPFYRCQDGSGDQSCLAALVIALSPVGVASSGSLAYWYLWSIARLPLGFARSYENRIRPRIDLWTRRCLLCWFVPGIIFVVTWPWATVVSQREHNANAERTYHYSDNATLTWDDDRIPEHERIRGIVVSALLSIGCFVGLLPVCAFVVIFSAEVLRLKLMVRDLVLYLSRHKFDPKTWLESYARVADEWESTQERLGYMFGLYTLFVGGSVVDMTAVIYYAQGDMHTQAILWPLLATMVPPFAALMTNMANANTEADFVDNKVRDLVADPDVPFQDALRILYVTERRQLELTVFGRKIRPSDMPNAIATLVLAQVATFLGV